MDNKNEFKYYIVIFLFTVMYLVIVYFCFNEISIISTIITTITALIAAVTFWLQLKRSEKLNEATFIMNLNNQFISNDEMTRIEHALELFYNLSLEGNEEILDLDLDRD